MNAFGGGLQEQELTDKVDDEYDVLNDETFGVEVPSEDWDVEHLSEETEANNTASGTFFDTSGYSTEKRRYGDDGMSMLEESISHLVDDDEEDLRFRRGNQPMASQAVDFAKPFDDIFGPGSPQTPFFQFGKTDNIWSSSPVTAAPLQQKPRPDQSISNLLDRMQLSNSMVAPEPPPLLIRGAKTAEELEAEMLGKTTQTSPRIPMGAVKSCEEIERELLEGSRASAALQQIPLHQQQHQLHQQPPPLHPLLAAAQAQGFPIPGMPLPQLNFLMRPPQGLLQPNSQQLRALAARVMANPPGGLPPPYFMPPMMPPPRPGYGNAGPRAPNGPHPNFIVRPRPIHPLHSMGLPFPHDHPMRRMPPPPLAFHNSKRRLFDNQHHRFGNDNFERNDRHRGDPYAGLMTRRERGWLIKIQTLQLMSDNAYADDYYWLMYKKRKQELAAANGERNTLLCKDTDHNDNLEPRVYVPPSFEGSLGKVQVLSANCPRQVLDLNASNGENKTPDEDESSGASSPVKAMQSGRRLKHALIEIENSYVLLLQAGDMILQQAAAESNELKAEIAQRAKSILSNIVGNLITDDHIVNTLSIRKGRRLLSQLIPLCDKDNCFKITQVVLRNIVSIVKREASQELLAVFQHIFNTKLTDLNAADWSALWTSLKIDVLEVVLKHKLGYAVLLFLAKKSAEENVLLTKEAAKIVERWVTVLNDSRSADQQQVIFLDKNHAATVSSWLENTCEIGTPASVFEAIGGR